MLKSLNRKEVVEMNNVIIQNFYDVISPMLKFKSCIQITEIQKNLLKFICKIFNCDNLYDDCWKKIEGLNSLQTINDDSSSLSFLNQEFDVFYEIKLRYLSDEEIKKLVCYDEKIFLNDMTIQSANGNIKMTRLLAFFYLLGFNNSTNLEKIIKMLKFLSLNGDKISQKLLIYILEKEKNDELYFWQNVITVYENELNNYSFIALYENYDDDKKIYVDYANYILCLKNENINNRYQQLNLALLDYILKSND